MGKAAAQPSDITIVTSDNPRTEDRAMLPIFTRGKRNGRPENI